jgi:hypothetical protein
MFLVSALAVGVFATAALPGVKWITPQGYSWGSFAPNTEGDLTIEVEAAEPVQSAKPVYLEYRVDGHGTSAPWTQLGASSVRSPKWYGPYYHHRRFYSNGVHYVEARLSNGDAVGPSSAAFFTVGPVEPYGWLDAIKTGIGVASKLFGSAGTTGQASVTLPPLSAPLSRVEYSVGDSGVWQHAGDFPKGAVQADIAITSPQPLEAGAQIPVHFRAFDGVAWTPEASQPVVTLTVNDVPKVASVGSQEKPLSVVAGQDVSLPVTVTDADKDQLHVLCVFDGGAKVAAAAYNDGKVVLPASAFEGQLSAGAHTLNVYGFDGHQLSAKSVKVAYVASGSGEGESTFGPLGIAGIAVGGVALVALVAVVIVFRRKGKKEQSSTGLIEDE